jgi:hypothetical protein
VKDRRTPAKREAKRSRAAGASPEAAPARPHPAFGPIPLVRIERALPDGQVWRGWECDPDYLPPLPAGAVRGDPRRQSFCAMCHVPRYFYVDQEKRCAQCGADFVFSATEQKFWYETLKFHFDSTAIRCAACRRRRRTESGLRERLARIRAALAADDSDHPGLLLELAEVIVELRQRTGQGRLDDALAASRRAFRAWPQAFQALYWEGAAHAAAGRAARAAECFARFAELGRSRPKGLRTLLDRAETFIQNHSTDVAPA